MIEVRSVYKQFGGVHAVENATLKIERGSITGLIGPNGAGKTTLFNIIAGNIVPSSGQILLDGQDVTGLPPHQLFNKGLLRTFQLAHEFSTLTVLENLMMVPDHQLGEGLMSAWFSWGEVKRQEAEIRERAMDVINFLNLGHVAEELAGNLSGRLNGRSEQRADNDVRAVFDGRLCGRSGTLWRALRVFGDQKQIAATTFKKGQFGGA